MYAGLCMHNSKPLQTGCVHGVKLKILAQIIGIFYLNAINIFGKNTCGMPCLHILNAINSFYDTA